MDNMVIVKKDTIEDLAESIDLTSRQIVPKLNDSQIKLSALFESMQNFDIQGLKKEISSLKYELELEKFIKKEEILKAFQNIDTDSIKNEIKKLNFHQNIQDIKLLDNRMQRVEASMSREYDEMRKTLEVIQKTKKNQTLLVSVFASIVSILVTALIFQLLK